MTDVIDFVFWIQNQLWGLIIANWILAFSVLIIIIGWIIGLIHSTMKR